MSKRIQNKKLIEERRAINKKNKIRKRNILIIVSLVFIALIIAIIIISKIPSYIKIEVKDGKYVAKNGIVYLAAPQNYEPVSYTQKPYGKLDKSYFYPITGKDTDEWLAEDFFGMLGVYYNEDITLPTLENFYPTRIQVCYDSKAAIARVADIQDYDDVTEIIGTVMNGTDVGKPSSSNAVYTLRISSEKYSWLYYNIMYIVTDDGDYYLDRGTGRCVHADDVVGRYLENKDNLDTEESIGTAANSEEGKTNAAS